MSDPFAINRSATARTLHVAYSTICTPPTQTFPPPPCKTTTRDSGLPTTAINFSKPLSIRPKMRWTTHPPDTRPTPMPSSSQFLSGSCSRPDSSMMTEKSGGASLLTTRPGHASRNYSQLPTKNGGICRTPRPVLSSSRPITPISNPITHIKVKRSKPSPTLQQPLPVIAPRSQLSLRPIVHSPPTTLTHTHNS